MSSIGVTGTSGACGFSDLLLFRQGRCSPAESTAVIRKTTQEFIALKANFRNPCDWQALIRLINEENVASLSARRMIVVGRPPVGSGLVPAALRLSLTRSAWCLIV